MKPLLDTSEQGIQRERRFREMELSDPRFRALDGSWDVLSGLHSALMGQHDLARRLFLDAQAKLVRELSQTNRADVEARFVAASAEELEADTPSSMKGMVTVSGGSIRVPADASVRSEWWTGLGLCRWFLENKHDAEAFGKASEELHEFFRTHPESLEDADWMDPQGRTFHAAGDDQRVIDYLSRPGVKFRPPTRPQQVRSERSMAWVLAVRRLRGEWDDERVEKAWRRFLSVQVPRLIECGEKVGLAVWLKVRHWDATTPKPDPYDAFLRVYDHLPGVEPPRVQR